MVNLADRILILIVFLIIHFIISKKGWYYKYPTVDSLPHLLGGIVLGTFIKEMYIALPLIFLWELLEATLVREGRKRFKESPWNKVRDIFFSFAGYFIAFFYV